VGQIARQLGLEWVLSEVESAGLRLESLSLQQLQALVAPEQAERAAFLHSEIQRVARTSRAEQDKWLNQIVND
jgi:hypothetical protein